MGVTIFLMNRRGALVTLGLTAFGGVARALANPFRLSPWKVANTGLGSFEAQTKNTIDDSLREDLARLAPRVYSEEGIPVFLACENLVVDKGSREPAKVALAPLNSALASAFHRNAQAFQRIRPDVQAKDVAPLIEVLADRDFTNGGTAEER